MTTPHLEVRDARAAAAGAPVKRSYVQRIFSEIAPRYDLLNRLLSGGIDRSGRRAAIAALGVERRADGTYLDLCAGTLDVGAAISRRPAFCGN
ncbi:MAG: class I SAM-dependent methyltransferase, partial [Gemmatimonadales bacterium]